MKKNFPQKAIASFLSVMILSAGSNLSTSAKEILQKEQAAGGQAEPAAYDGEKEEFPYHIWNKEDGTLGDANGDGQVTIADARSVLQTVLKLNTESDEENYTIDVNGDGAIDLQDVQFILKGSLGIITDLEEIYNINQVTRYFKENVEQDPWGDYSLIFHQTLFETEKEYMINYYPKENCLEFVQMSVIEHINKREYITVHFKYDITNLRAVDHKIYFSASSYSPGYEYSEEAVADFDSAAYQIKDLPYKVTHIEGYPWQPTYDHANDTTKISFSYWNEMLYNACKIKLNQIGFRSYQKH